MASKDLEKERDEGGDEIGLKVTDRRLFTAEGELRDELSADEDTETPGSEAQSQSQPEPSVEQAHGEAGFERHPIEEPDGVDFTVLVNAMAQPALIFLGEIEHPGTGKPEVDLEQARVQIDLLTVLKVKSRGNLTREEEGLLDRLLYQLQMLYVAKSGQTAPPA